MYRLEHGKMRGAMFKAQCAKVDIDTEVALIDAAIEAIDRKAEAAKTS